MPKHILLPLNPNPTKEKVLRYSFAIAKLPLTLQFLIKVIKGKTMLICDITNYCIILLFFCLNIWVT